jgi:hypothetical protein
LLSRLLADGSQQIQNKEIFQFRGIIQNLFDLALRLDSSDILPYFSNNLGFLHFMVKIDIINQLATTF